MCHIFEDIDIASSINGIVSLMSPSIQSKQLTFNYNYEAETAFSDQNLLNTVLRNIFDNAIKFSRIGGTIDINVFDQSSTVCISIRDHGEGLEAADAERLFEPQTDLKEINKQSEGKSYCMGLRISKALVALLDGTISARGFGNNGTEILIELSQGQ